MERKKVIKYIIILFISIGIIVGSIFLILHFTNKNKDGCKNGYFGTKCNLKEFKGKQPNSKQKTTFRPIVKNDDPVNDVYTYDQIADFLEKNNYKYWFNSITKNDIEKYGGRVYSDGELVPTQQTPTDQWRTYELVNTENYFSGHIE